MNNSSCITSTENHVCKSYVVVIFDDMYIYFFLIARLHVVDIHARRARAENLLTGHITHEEDPRT